MHDHWTQDSVITSLPSSFIITLEWPKADKRHRLVLRAVARLSSVSEEMQHHGHWLISFHSYIRFQDWKKTSDIPDLYSSSLLTNFFGSLSRLSFDCEPVLTIATTASTLKSVIQIFFHLYLLIIGFIPTQKLHCIVYISKLKSKPMSVIFNLRDEKCGAELVFESNRIRTDSSIFVVIVQLSLL